DPEELGRGNMSLDPLDSSAALKSEPLCIFGTGDLGRSLGQCLLQSGYGVVYGSRRPDSCGPLPQGAQVMTHQEAAQFANLIFICVHREHYDFLEMLAPHLEGKVRNILRTNQFRSSSSLCVLSRLVPKAAVVKGLNTVSAWALQNGLPSGTQVYLCGNNEEAKRAVAEMATKLGLTVLDRGSLSAARELEDFPLRLFPEWRIPLWVAFSLTAAFFIYLVIRNTVYDYVNNGQDVSYGIMVSLANKVFAAVSLIMLSLCYLPGCIAAFLQLYRGTKYRRFPDWLDRWMLCRKQMGLVALGFALLHAIYSLINPLRYVSTRRTITSVVQEVRRAAPNHLQSWRIDSFYALGILGFFLYVLLGLTSLPSVGGSLSWREFSFVQVRAGASQSNSYDLVSCESHKITGNNLYKPTSFFSPRRFVTSTRKCTVLLFQTG
uniref:STEAP family member 4 n=1 Tax=Acanthochromis polyacanthus TaxID=80966 RepID=A0A3Q1EHH2_9TELE